MLPSWDLRSEKDRKAQVSCAKKASRSQPRRIGRKIKRIFNDMFMDTLNIRQKTPKR